MLEFLQPIEDTPLRQAIRAALSRDEAACDAILLERAALDPDAAHRIETEAVRLVNEVRRRRSRTGDLDTFLSEYRLSTREGVVLMCLAEALLRIPDPGTADELIRDKIADIDWSRHLGHSDALLVNASTWALMLSGRLMGREGHGSEGVETTTKRLVARLGEPVVRQALSQAMRIMGRQFVMGRTITEALDRAKTLERNGFRHSFDMLGEAARTKADTERYYHAYADAITVIGKAAAGLGPVAGPGISVKLSALHPRFEYGQRDRMAEELVPRLGELCRLAKSADIGLTIDAEEADRLEPTLDVLRVLVGDPALAGWDGLGIAVQAYQKRASTVVDWVLDLARAGRRRLMVRLVKGAYWDSEIKRAQERGLDYYPVFTRKAATDVSYLVCARALLAAKGAVYPQFATHNAHTVAAVCEWARGRQDWEFQRLHGMGDVLYGQIVSGDGGVHCRTYAPVGSHEELLPYLVRRLLENGANMSFVNRIADDAEPVARIVANPIEALKSSPSHMASHLRLPADLYQPERRAARGWNLSDPVALAALSAELEAAGRQTFTAVPVVSGNDILAGAAVAVRDPSDQRRVIGTVISAAPEDAAHAVRHAAVAAPVWDRLGGVARAAILDRAADLYEQSAAELMWLAIREAGKTVDDAVAEVREAVDFLRYYAARAREDFSSPRSLPGVTGETNVLSLHGRGVFACISPWNFPLAIFTGQVAAALAAGNGVVAKPAEQTPLIAARAVRLLHEAGIPADILHLLPGDGEIGGVLVAQPEIAGVAFTGSVATAWAIQHALAAKEGPIVPFIAETGGINAMIVDSSALPEQVVADVVVSAFRSAGQRCSALRLLFLQDEIHDRIVGMLAGAARELTIGDPGLLSTDVGPVIDSQARADLRDYVLRMKETAGVRLLFEGAVPEDAAHGLFVPPCAFAIDRAEMLTREVFGPVLHVVRYRACDLDQVLDSINAAGYGLTLGVQSRVDSFAEAIRGRVAVGNLYVNRSMIGAVVGTQPFGGEGLSGSGPKTGGPFTLYRYATERTYTVNRAASGGDMSLLAMSDDDL